MGKGNGLRRSVLLAVTAATVLLLAQACTADPGSTKTRSSWKSLSSLIDGPVLLDPLDFDAGLSPIGQDVVTTEEYDRLTGVHKRVGLGLFGGFGLLSGGAAGHGTILTNTMDADYGDIWNIMGFSGGVDLTIMVMPIYTVNIGIGGLFHAGDSTGGNSWGDLVAMPFYLGMRINLPLGVSPDRWFDFHNPDIAAEKHGMIPIPYAKIKAIGFLMREVYIDGWAVNPTLQPGSTEQFFRRGIYGGAFLGGGIELRFASIGIYGEVGIRYIWHPKHSLRFDEFLTNGDFFMITCEFGFSYYFGAGRLIKVD